MLSRAGLLAALGALVCLLAASGGRSEELDEFGGCKGARRAATGFFRTTRAEGRWWLIDPNGFPFISMGVNAVSLYPSSGPAKESPYRQSALALYRRESAWAEAAVKRLRDWGFNTLGAGSDESLRKLGMPYTISLDCARSLPLAEGQLFPDVFDPNYERAVRRRVVRACKRAADDPWLLGYFTDGPLHWGPDEDSPDSLLVQFLGMSDKSPGRHALLHFLGEFYPGIAELNRAWGTEYETFDEIGRTPQVGSHIPEADVEAFQRRVAAEYFRVAHDAIRAADSHHLILGPRFDRDPSVPVLEAMDDYASAVCLNCCAASPPVEQMRRISQLAGWPVIVSEFGFQVGERTQPHRGGPGTSVASQQARAAAYERYVRELMALPTVVGYHWWAYADEPADDTPLPDVVNCGLVGLDDEPYPALVEGATQVNATAYRLAASGRPEDSSGSAEDSG